MVNRAGVTTAPGSRLWDDDRVNCPNGEGQPAPAGRRSAMLDRGAVGYPLTVSKSVCPATISVAWSRIQLKVAASGSLVPRPTSVSP
jgi:hypothetical protein